MFLLETRILTTEDIPMTVFAADTEIKLKKLPQNVARESEKKYLNIKYKHKCIFVGKRMSTESKFQIGGTKIKQVQIYIWGVISADERDCYIEIRNTVGRSNMHSKNEEN